MAPPKPPIDWLSPEGRDLLREAWPDGYALAPGVTTLESFFCVRAYGPCAAFTDSATTFHEAPDASERPEIRARGGLLPLVDRNDQLGWCALTRELAVAAFGQADVEAAFWIRFSGADKEWWIDIGRRAPPTRARMVKLSRRTEDPAEALVRTRAFVRRYP